MTLLTRLSLLAVCAAAVSVPLLIRPDLSPADSTPVGALPRGPVTTISVWRGAPVAMALPEPSSVSGLTWRLARPVDSTVLRQSAETEAGGTIVVLYRAVGAGTVRVVFALTRGDASAKAVATRSYRVIVSASPVRSQSSMRSPGASTRTSTSGAVAATASTNRSGGSRRYSGTSSTPR